MKWLVRLYPSEWRDRYGAELEYALEHTPLTPGNVIDTLKGAILMHASFIRKPKVILGCAVFSAALMFLATFGMANRYESITYLTLRGADPNAVLRTWLNDDLLARLRDRHGLYPGIDRPLAIEYFKRDIAVRPRPEGTLFGFYDANATRSRAVTDELLAEGFKTQSVVETRPQKTREITPARTYYALVGLGGGLLFGLVGSFVVRFVRKS